MPFKMKNKKLRVVSSRLRRKGSQPTLNHLITVAAYKRLIKELKKNNKSLCLALQDEKCNVSRQNDNLQDYARDTNQIMYARIKLKDMAATIQKLVTDLSDVLKLVDITGYSANHSRHRELKLMIKVPENSPIAESCDSSVLEPETPPFFPATQDSPPSHDNSATEIYHLPTMHLTGHSKENIKLITDLNRMTLEIPPTPFETTPTPVEPASVAHQQTPPTPQLCLSPKNMLAVKTGNYRPNLPLATDSPYFSRNKPALTTPARMQSPLKRNGNGLRRAMGTISSPEVVSHFGVSPPNAGFRGAYFQPQVFEDAPSVFDRTIFINEDMEFTEVITRNLFTRLNEGNAVLAERIATIDSPRSTADVGNPEPIFHPKTEETNTLTADCALIHPNEKASESVLPKKEVKDCAAIDNSSLSVKPAETGSLVNAADHTPCLGEGDKHNVGVRRNGRREGVQCKNYLEYEHETDYEVCSSKNEKAKITKSKLGRPENEPLSNASAKDLNEGKSVIKTEKAVDNHSDENKIYDFSASSECESEESSSKLKSKPRKRMKKDNDKKLSKAPNFLKAKTPKPNSSVLNSSSQIKKKFIFTSKNADNAETKEDIACPPKAAKELNNRQTPVESVASDKKFNKKIVTSSEEKISHIPNSNRKDKDIAKDAVKILVKTMEGTDSIAMEPKTSGGSQGMTTKCRESSAEYQRTFSGVSERHSKKRGPAESLDLFEDIEQAFNFDLDRKVPSKKFAFVKKISSAKSSTENMVSTGKSDPGRKDEPLRDRTADMAMANKAPSEFPESGSSVLQEKNTTHGSIRKKTESKSARKRGGKAYPKKDSVSLARKNLSESIEFVVDDLCSADMRKQSNGMPSRSKGTQGASSFDGSGMSSLLYTPSTKENISEQDTRPKRSRTIKSFKEAPLNAKMRR